MPITEDGYLKQMDNKFLKNVRFSKEQYRPQQVRDDILFHFTMESIGSLNLDLVSKEMTAVTFLGHILRDLNNFSDTLIAHQSFKPNAYNRFTWIVRVFGNMPRLPQELHATSQLIYLAEINTRWDTDSKTGGMTSFTLTWASRMCPEETVAAVLAPLMYQYPVPLELDKAVMLKSVLISVSSYKSEQDSAATKLRELLDFPNLVVAKTEPTINIVTEVSSTIPLPSSTSKPECPSAAPACNREEPQGVKKDECVVCMDATKSVILIPCWHYCLCEGCADEVKSCPICRGVIERVQKIFPA